MYFILCSFSVAAMISAVNPSNQSFTFRENNQQALVINITVDGNPAPTYEWTRNGVAVVNSSTITVTRTSFRAYAVRENHGNYVVTYQNNMGTAVNHSFNMDVLCKYMCIIDLFKSYKTNSHKSYMRLDLGGVYLNLPVLQSCNCLCLSG